MDFGHDRMKMNVEGDRLSNLPDELIHKIFSFISSKHVVETSVLSSRWRLIWTTMPYLNFSSDDFDTLPRFSDFVTNFLSGHRVEVYSVKLSFRGKIGQAKRTLDYALSHNVQRLSVTCLLEKDIEFPLYIFYSRSLKHLSLKGVLKHGRVPYNIFPISNWDLPALTTLHLHKVALPAYHNDLFSKCANLESLTLTTCKVLGLNHIRICHPLLSNLTLEDVHPGSMGNVNVAAPRLKNLTIRKWSRELLVSAPDLASFLFNSYHPLRLSTDGFCSLEKVELCISSSCKADTHQIVCLLEQLYTVQFLTLNLEIVELLSSQAELISDHPSPFSKLKSLKIYPENLYIKESPNLPTEVKKYLLDGSSSATCTMVSRKEVRAVRDTASARKLIAELRVLLESEEAKSKRARTRMQPLTCIRSCLEDLAQHVKERETKALSIISMLQSIEELLRDLPISKRAKLQEHFHALRAEAGTIIDKAIGDMMFECAMKRSRVSLCFQKLAAASQRST